MNFARKSLRFALVAAVVLEISVLSAGAFSRWQSASYMIATGAPLPSLQGYGRNLAAGPFKSPSACVIYRFVSVKCVDCSLEEPKWRQPAVKDAIRRCQTIILQVDLQDTPYYKERTATPQILWVPLDWARSVKLTITPTTIVTFDGEIVWVKEGELGSSEFARLAKRVEGLPGG